MDAFAGFDHLDVRVSSLLVAEPFYDRFLPALGLPRKRHAYVDERGEWTDLPDGAVPNVAEFYENRAAEWPRFFGIIEDRAMRPTQTRIAFRVRSSDELEAWYERLHQMGARCIERSSDMSAYPAIFFEDPCGTRLELCAPRPRR